MEDQELDMLVFIGMVVVIICVLRFVLKNKSTSSHFTTRQADYPPVSGQEIVTHSSTAPEAVRAAPSSEIKGIFVIVTSPDPQTQIMAMSLSTQVKSKGKFVRILLCGPAGELVLKIGKEIMVKPLNKSPQMLLKNLIQSGVIVEICPFFLAEKGITVSALIQGVKPADPSAVADGLLEAGIKLFAL